MIELVIGIVAGMILWRLRQPFYNQAELFNEKVELSVSDSKVDIQKDYEELLKKIEDRKAKQDGKWHTMSDIDSAMNTSEPTK